MQQRHQHILTRFPKSCKIIFVQPSLIGALLQRRKESKVRSNNNHVNKNIHVVSMPIIHKTDRNSIFRRMNDMIIVLWSKLILKRFRIKQPVVLFYEPRFSPVIGKLGESLVWYELIDDRLAFSEVPSRMKDNIEELMAKADFITTSSEKLYQIAKSGRGINTGSKITKQDAGMAAQNMPNQDSDVFMVGNGVDFEHFAKIQHNYQNKDVDSNIINKSNNIANLTDAKILPEMIRNSNQPIVGYFGSVGEWFDFELVEKILKAFPTLFILVIGFVFPKESSRTQALEREYQNIRFLGRRDYSILPSYLQAFAVAIIPFKIYSLTESVNPTKFYEYCAGGKPIITTAIPELERYQDLICYAHNHEEFLGSLSDLISDNETRKQNVEQLRNIAKENSWDKKVQIIMGIIYKFLPNTKQAQITDI
jgi:glycosyltransferase involved in cell wall biosynthesis